ncbi:MAG: hypothetical protein M1840_005658 [Geoglossum simile]|nr:MAG: hypothetical protein M1840_005658 [Geoglossum simile]
MSVCCGCLSCCRGRGSSRGPKHHEEPTSYKGAPPPTTNGYTPNQPPSYAPPQFAAFATSNKDGTGGKAVNGDALPAMPTWESARTRKVLMEAEPPQKGHADDVELGDLNHSGKTTGSRAPMLAHAAPPAGYDDIGVASTMQSPYGNPQDRGHGPGYEKGHEPISPYGQPQDFAAGYKRSGTSKPPYGQAYGSPQQMPEGPYHQGHRPRSPYPIDNDDYFGNQPQNNTSGYGDSTHAYSQHENFQPQIRNGYAVVNTRSPPPTFQTGGFSPRSQSPFNQENNSYDHGGTRTPPVKRQNTGGYTSDAQRPLPNAHSTTADLPTVLTAGPKSRTPPSAYHQNVDGSYRAYSPSPASPTYAAYQPTR